MFNILFAIVIVFGFDSFKFQTYEFRWFVVFAIAFIFQLGAIRNKIWDVEKQIKKLGKK